MKGMFSSLSVAALSFIISAFANIKKVEKCDVYVHSGIDEFTRLREDLYDSSNCDIGGSYKCIYRITKEGAMLLTGSFNKEYILLYLNTKPNPYIVAEGSYNGIYTP